MAAAETASPGFDAQPAHTTSRPQSERHAPMLPAGPRRLFATGLLKRPPSAAMPATMKAFLVFRFDPALISKTQLTST
jgi:hypothetical protein